jgi:membrane associated rhomboid family serine protease
MIVIPIGREDAVIQRHAWVTYTLIVLNVVIFLLFCLGSTDAEEATLIRTWRETILYLRERPYLTTPWRVVNLVPRDLAGRTPVRDPAVPDWKAAKEQAEVDEMAAELRRSYDATDSIRFAYVPAVNSIPTIVTSMFLHAGLFHLLGNLLFLFITAPFIEDAYGRVLFPILYLTGGVVATLAFAARYPDSVIPLVGASGAISAVMGAYLVRFARSKIRMMVIPVIFLPFWSFRFSVPALVVFGLWFLEQLVSIPAEGGSGVAVTAHVAGFAYGLAFAGLMKAGRVEQRWIQPAIEKEIAWTVDPQLDAMRVALDSALWSGEPSRIDPAAAKLLDAYAAANEKQLALDLIAEVRSSGRTPQFLARAAAMKERWGDRADAIDLLERLTETDAAVTTLVKLATLRRAAGDRAGALDALQRALAQPDCSPEWRRRIDSTMALL